MAIDPFWDAVINAHEAVLATPETHIEIERDTRKATVDYSPMLDMVIITVAEKSADG